MIVVIEKQEIKGVLKTSFGNYPLLSNQAVVNRPYSNSQSFGFRAVDDEGFVSEILVHGDFVVVPASLPTFVEVKRLLSAQEEAEVSKESIPNDEYPESVSNQFFSAKLAQVEQTGERE